jgi:hypothetical protein
MNEPVFPDTKYMKFIDRSLEGAKTRKVFVCGITSGMLGEIKWFGRWRQYAFFPSRNTIFNPDCMMDICSVIKKLKESRLKSRTEPKGE